MCSTAGGGRMRLFDKPGDDEAFERVLAETLELRPMRIYAYRIGAHPSYPWFRSSLPCVCLRFLPLLLFTSG